MSRARRVHRVLRSGAYDAVRETLGALRARDPQLAWSTYGHGDRDCEADVVTLSGPRAHEAAEVLDRALDPFTLDELLDAASSAPTPGGLELALVRLACAAPDDEHEGVVARILAALASDHSRVRRRALAVMAIRPWPAFLAPAMHAAAHDPDDEVRLQAKISLLELRDHAADARS